MSGSTRTSYALHSLKIFGLGLKFLRKIVEHYAVEHLIQLYHILDISAYKLISKGNWHPENTHGD